jgi:hypothetical protein
VSPGGREVKTAKAGRTILGAVLLFDSGGISGPDVASEARTMETIALLGPPAGLGRGWGAGPPAWGALAPGVRPAPPGRCGPGPPGCAALPAAAGRAEGAVTGR